MLTAKPLILKLRYPSVPVVPPVSEPVTPADFERQKKLTLDFSEYDKVAGFLTASRQLCEQYTRRAFMTQTWTASFDVLTATSPFDGFWYSDVSRHSRIPGVVLPQLFELRYPPLLAVSSIVYYLDDGTDVPTTWAASNYQVSTMGARGRIMLRTGVVWPTGLRPMDSILITYTAGYGSDVDVPQAIKEAIVEWAAHWYENREGQQAPNVGGAVVLDHGSFIPANVRSKLNPYAITHL
jgi:hypothetical protein